MNHLSLHIAPSDFEQSVPDRFRSQVIRHADRVALSGAGRAWTYRTLDRWTDAVAIGVRALADGPARPVAILVRDRATALASALAVLKAGQIVLHLDPEARKPHVLGLMEEAGAGLVIGGCPLGLPLRALAEAAGLPFLDLDSTAYPAQSGDEIRLCDIEPDDPAVLISTSGSTGRPKAVAYSHRDILRICLTNAQLDGLTAADRRLVVAAPGTSMGLGSFDGLLNGAAVFPFDLREGLIELHRLLEREKITVLHTVPAVFRALARTRPEACDYAHIRLVRLGGDEVRRQDVELFRRCFNEPAMLRVGYASTEAGLMTSCTFDTRTPLPEGQVIAGSPLEGVEVRVLDGRGGESPPGGEGEIAVRSAYVKMGYWRRSDLDGDLVVPDPRGEAGPFCRCGDRGRRLPDGRLQHLGRSRAEVKIGGLMVDLSGVERALGRIPRVAEAAVAVHPGASGEPRLVGYLVWSGKAESPQALRAALAQTLPSHCVPSAFVPLSMLPLTSSGKLDRAALRPPIGMGADSAGDFVGPAGELEHVIADLWKESLGISRVGLHDDFFAAGGDSMLAAEFVAKLWRRTGRELPASVLAHAPTVKGLADHLRAGERASVPTLIPLREGGTQSPLFLAHPLGGEVLIYRDLVRSLRIDRPIIGLRRDRLEEERPRYTRVEDMAAQYVRQIRTVQPTGPYHLCGLSFGGVIAFEIACQLSEAGERVGSLILLDPATPGGGTDDVRDSFIDRCHGAIQRARFHWAALKLMEMRERLSYLRAALARITRRLEGMDDEKGGVADDAVVARVPATERHRVDSYGPRVFRGRATMILAQLQPRGRDRLAYWRSFVAEGVDVRKVPGMHSFIVTEPFVRVLAKRIEASLSRRSGSTRQS